MSRLTLKRFLHISIILVAILAISAGVSSCSSRSSSSEARTITIGKMPLAAHALIYIADDQGFFQAEGLDVSVRDFNTGPEAISQLVENKVDISVAGEYAFVGSALKKEKISVIACIDKYQFFYLAGRKDRGISGVETLKGKKIGVAKGTSGEFFLGRFLNIHGISLQDITLLDLKPEKFVDAIGAGNVDAIVYTRQYEKTLKDRLGADLVFWPVQSDQLLYSVIICKNDWVSEHPETIKKLMKALVRAEKYMVENPAKAKEILRKNQSSDGDYIDAIWPDHRFSLRLDQSLIIAMEDEARWMTANNLTTEKNVPDFSKYIYEDGLMKVKPEAVNIIR